jgi:L-threonylcarbamoyladenylate synthase
LDSLSLQIKEAVRILKEGGVVAYPTDTVYGLGAIIDSAEAVEKIFLVKSRPRRMSLPLLVANVSQIESLTANISPVAHRLIEAFLPGAVTLVFSVSSRVPDYLQTPEGTIALRIPNHPVPIALISGIGTAIVGTSANLSGRPSPLTAREVDEQIGEKVELIIDGGRCPGTESTIIDVTKAVPVVLRRGAVSVSEIEKVCGISLGSGG